MLLVVSSNDYQNSDSSDIHVKLPSPVSAVDGYSLHVCLQSLTIANVQTNINRYCNEITVDGVTGEIDVGNYSAATLAEILDGQFDGVTVTYDETRGKMSITSTSTINLSGTVLDVLDIEPGAGTAFESVNYVRLSGNDTIHVITDLTTDHITSNSQRGLIASIPVDVEPYGVLYYRDDNGRQGSKIGNRTIFELRIRLLDSVWRSLLGNADYVAVLDIQHVYTGVRDLKITRPIRLAVDMTKI